MLESFGIEMISTAIAAIIALVKSISFVQEGELGIKLRFGKALKTKAGDPRVISPGFVFMVPFAETLRRHHVRQQTLRMADQKVMIRRGLIFNVSAMVIFRVNDIYKALFEIEDLTNSLEDLSMGILRDVLTSKEYLELSDMEAISNELLAELQEKAEEWGVTFIQFKLTNCAPTAESAPLVNAEAAVAMRVEALRSAAEGMKIDIGDIPPVLAASLIGVPLVTSVTS